MINLKNLLPTAEEREISRLKASDIIDLALLALFISSILYLVFLATKYTEIVLAVVICAVILWVCFLIVRLLWRCFAPIRKS